jgi:uroporphyrinogen decarboxylase
VTARHDARFLKACRLEPADATPVWFMRQAGRSLAEYREIRKRATLLEITADAALCAEVTLQPVRRLGVDAAIVFADITSIVPGLGLPLRLEDGVGPVIDPPVRSRADVEALQSFDAPSAVPGILGGIGILARESPVPVIGFAGAPFTVASYLVEGRSSRDALAVKRLMWGDRATFDALMDRLVDATIEYLAAQVAAGVDAIQLFDSWVGALSPDDYTQRIAPHMRRLFASLATLGVPTIHFGTGAAGLLRDLAAAGGDVIGLDWRIRLADAWRALPGRAVQGNLDPALMLGPFEEAERAARRILDDARGRPGHVFNLGHGVFPATDPDDLRRLVDLVHDVSAARRAA